MLLRLYHDMATVILGAMTRGIATVFIRFFYGETRINTDQIRYSKLVYDVLCFLYDMTRHRYD